MTKKTSPQFAAGGYKGAKAPDEIDSLLDEFSVEVLEAALGILKAQQKHRGKEDVSLG